MVRDREKEKGRIDWECGGEERQREKERGRKRKRRNAKRKRERAEKGGGGEEGGLREKGREKWIK